MTFKKGALFVFFTLVFLFVFSQAFFVAHTSFAAVEAWPAGKANECKSSQDGFIDFEQGSDGAVIQSNIPGTRFTNTSGYDWVYADWRTGNYNGKYPNGSYTSNGNITAWLGPNQGAGRIDFLEGTASYVSILTSTASGVVMDAFNEDGHLIDSSGWSSSNTNTGTMTRLTVEADGISYVIIHDTGNYWTVDDLCTDAKGVPPVYSAIVMAAKSVIGAKYQWGAKGYDFSPGTRSFTSNDKIVDSGYNYYDPDNKAVTFGKGLDCSGLNMWAYNHTFYGDDAVNWDTCRKGDGSKKCPIFYEGAHGQWESNSTKQFGAPKIADLHAGDLLFFNTKGTKDKNGGPVIDHTAMYVGSFEFTSGEVYNVIHASGYAHSVVPAWYDDKTGKLSTKSLPPSPEATQNLSVTSWGSISDARLDAWVITHSPVHVSVTDPDGIRVSLENTLADENGRTNEVPGMSYMVASIDGKAEDTVAIAELKQGAYFINIELKPDATPTDTYSLEVRFPDLGEETLWLAKDAIVAPQTLVIENTADGVSESSVVKMQIKPLDSKPCINTKSKGNIPVVLFGSANTPAELIATGTIQIDNDSDRTTEGLKPTRIALEDVDKDGHKDVVLHFDTQSLNASGLLQDEHTVFITARTHDDRLVIGRDTVYIVGGTQCGYSKK